MRVLKLTAAIVALAVIGSLLLMRSAELIPVPRTAENQAHGAVRAAGAGFRFIFRSPSLRISFLMVAVIGTLGFNFNVLLPLEARSVLHAGPAVFGLLTSSLGAGGAVVAQNDNDLNAEYAPGIWSACPSRSRPRRRSPGRCRERCCRAGSGCRAGRRAHRTAV